MSTTLTGLDVSNYQGLINWKAVAPHISFAAMKASEGTAYRDPTFPRNWQAVKAAGIPRIAYHFFRPGLSAVAQADYFHAAVRDGGHFGEGDAALLDLETVDGVPAQAIVNGAAAWVLRIRETVTPAGGPIQVCLYTGPSYWLQTLGSPTDAVLAACPLWVASYGAAPPPFPNWPHGLAFWQYTDSGSVPGVRGPVDMDRFYGDAQALLEVLASPGGG